jgi:uncharacterized protein (PEP-CTERM system associated)
VNLASGETKKKSDLITTLSPGVGVHGAGGRVNLNLSYTAEQSIYKRESGRDDLHHSLTAAGAAELWQRQLFFDAQAAIFRQLISPTQGVSATPGVSAVNSADTMSFSAGPRFLHHIGPYVDTVSTITHSEVHSTPTNAANASGTLSATALGAANSDTTTNSANFAATSGREFTRLQWSLTTGASKTDRGRDQPGVDSKTVDTNYTYIINRKYALLAGLGWQQINDSTLAQPVRGITWSVGARLTPGPRTSFSLNYNDRDNSKFFSFNGSYLISSRTTFTASYGESLTFSQQQLASSLAFLGVAPDGTFIDTRTGLPFNPGNQDFALQTQTSRTTTFTATLIGTRGRNTFSAAFSHADQTTDATGMVQVTNNGTVTWSRQINHRLTGSLAFNYQTTDQTPVALSSNRLVGTVTFNYLLTPTATAALAASTSRLDSTDSAQNTSETSVTLTLRKTF